MSNIKRIIASILLNMCLMFALTGCAKCISTEYENVEVNIVDEYHRGMYVTPIRAGKVTTMVTHPAVYRITVEYNGVEYTISGSDTYTGVGLTMYEAKLCVKKMKQMGWKVRDGKC